MSAITDAYRHALPLMIQSISPRLAALHVSRVKLLTETSASTSNYTSTNACLSCGAMLHLNATRRATRKAARWTRSKPQGSSGQALSRMRVVTETCDNCGQVRRHEISRRELKEMPSVRRMRSCRVETNVEEDTFIPPVSTFPAPIHILSTVASKPKSPSPSTPSTPNPLPAIESRLIRSHAEPTGKSRPKKRVGLQEMLARNRNQKDKAAAAEGKRATGLADFLVEL